MKEEIFKRLDAIAAKLGVASENLWRILITQVKVDLYQDVFWAALCVGGTVLFGWLSYKSGKDEEAEPMVGFALLAILFFVISAICLNCIVGYAINPEYYALQKAFELIKDVK